MSIDKALEHERPAPRTPVVPLNEVSIGIYWGFDDNNNVKPLYLDIRHVQNLGDGCMVGESLWYHLIYDDQQNMPTDADRDAAFQLGVGRQVWYSAMNLLSQHWTNPERVTNHEPTDRLHEFPEHLG